MKGNALRSSALTDFTFCDRASRLNPPLPVDEHGNWYRDDDDDDEARRGSGESPGGESPGGESPGRGDDGLTDAERAILADIDPA